MIGNKTYSKYIRGLAHASTVSQIIVLVFMSAVVFAQDLSVEAGLDTNELLIGDQVDLVLSVQFPKDETLLWPQIGDTLVKEIEVLDRTMDDTISEEGAGMLKIKRTYTITSFDSGYFVIPPFVFSFAGDTAQVTTELLLITVKTIEVDTSIAFKDIKSPFDVPYTLVEFLPQILTALIILFGLLIAYLAYKKLKSRERPVIEVVVPEIPPHIVAFEKLKRLEERKLWQKDKVKHYYIDLTEITRTYIENRFDIIAMELTTDEIISAMSYVSVSQESKKELSHMLRLADMVKFAKHKPLTNEHELCMKHAFDFVNATKLTITESTQNGTDTEVVNLPPL